MVEVSKGDGLREIDFEMRVSEGWGFSDAVAVEEEDGGICCDVAFH